jgi:hypothetical protein
MQMLYRCGSEESTANIGGRSELRSVFPSSREPVNGIFTNPPKVSAIVKLEKCVVDSTGRMHKFKFNSLGLHISASTINLSAKF